jgi:hypothetical protein
VSQTLLNLSVQKWDLQGWGSGSGGRALPSKHNPRHHHNKQTKTNHPKEGRKGDERGKKEEQRENDEIAGEIQVYECRACTHDEKAEMITIR